MRKSWCWRRPIMYSLILTMCIDSGRSLNCDWEVMGFNFKTGEIFLVQDSWLTGLCLRYSYKVYKEHSNSPNSYNLFI